MAKELVIGVICLCCGVLIGYFIWGNPAPVDCCKYIKENPTACETTLAPPAGITLEADVTNIQNAYSAYEAAYPNDCFGFSLDKGLIGYLNQLLVADQQIKAFRVYPGMTTTDRKTIFVSLADLAGTGRLIEEASKPKGFQTRPSLNGQAGPCPTWCDMNPGARFVRQ